MSNADLFTIVAREYASFRPGYPPELFAWLARVSPSREAVWDVEAFHIEAWRVSRPGAVVAVWTYPRPRFVDAALDGLFEDFYSNVVGPHWPPERKHVDADYATLPPFPEDLGYALLAAPEFGLTLEWNLAQLLGYVSSWSATARYKKANGTDPVPLLEAALARVWTDPNSRLLLRMPLGLKAARPHAP